jgi:hypothetical protein
MRAHMVVTLLHFFSVHLYVLHVDGQAGVVINLPTGQKTKQRIIGKNSVFLRALYASVV